MTNTKLTTVKIVKDVYSKFKQLSFDSNITLQKLVNRSINNYILVVHNFNFILNGRTTKEKNSFIIG
jgi:hypothetical protein